MLVNLTYKVQAPLLEGTIDMYWLQRQIFELLSSYKPLALVKSFYKIKHIREQRRPIIPNPQDFVSCGFAIMMPTTNARMELVYDFYRLFFI